MHFTVYNWLKNCTNWLKNCTPYNFFHGLCVQIIVCLLQKLFAFSDGPRRNSSSDADATVHNAEVLLVCPVNK